MNVEHTPTPLAIIVKQVSPMRAEPHLNPQLATYFRSTLVSSCSSGNTDFYVRVRRQYENVGSQNTTWEAKTWNHPKAMRKCGNSKHNVGPQNVEPPKGNADNMGSQNAM